VEDQGWVAWFAIASLLGRDITIFGDGKQVRDVLHVDDLLRAYEAAIRAPDKVAQQAFNVGGGPDQVLSLLDLIEMLEDRLGITIPLKWDDWRPGDQQVYISDIRKLGSALGWKPEIAVEEGIDQLIDWVEQNRSAFETEREAAQRVLLADGAMRDGAAARLSAGTRLAERT
jgi:CDP-paratose 2-epimerase